MGQVLQAGCGQLPARQAAVKGGIAMSVALADRQQGLPVRAERDRARRPDDPRRRGRHRGRRRDGVDDQRAAPAAEVAAGFKYGDVTMLDHMAYDGLWDVFTDQAMGSLTDAATPARSWSAGPTRTPSRRGPTSAPSCDAAGVFAREIVEVPVPQRQGDPVLVGSDEGIRSGVTAESLAGLRPAFGADGTITAGLVLADLRRSRRGGGGQPEAAERLGLTVLGRDRRIRQRRRAGLVPAAAAGQRDRDRPKKQQLAVADLDLIEINEAFAAVGVASARALGLTDSQIEERVNVDGGAIALGHPIGASGARLVLHLAVALHHRGGGTAVASLCGGGGQGDALILTAG